MFTFVRRSGILIPREYENELFYDQIKRHLTRAFVDYHTKLSEIKKFYIESKDYLIVPRFIDLDYFIKDYKIIDNKNHGRNIDISHNIKPRNETQEKAINHLMTNDKGILKLPPGTGKTVITIYSICEKKKKAIIFVYRDSLVEQWKGEFLKHTNIKEDDIAILKSNKFKEHLEKPIIISTVQTFLSLIKRKPGELIKAVNDANIGVTVFDEVHTSGGAPKFSLCSLFVNTNQVYGLSATPFRNDNTEDIMISHFGEVEEDENICGTLVPKVTLMMFDFGICTDKMKKYIYWGGQFIRSRYLKQLTKSVVLKSLLKKLVYKFYNEERKMIIIMERLKFIDETMKEFSDIKELDKFVSGSKLENLLNNKVVLTTPGKCRDGVNDIYLDALLMTSPVSNMEQLGGRIIRERENKKRPIIVDMIDIGCEDIFRTSINRIKFYEQKDWETQYVLFKNNAMKMVDKKEHSRILQEFNDKD